MSRTLKFGVFCPTEQCLAAYVIGSIEVGTTERASQQNWLADFTPVTLTCVECGVRTQYNREQIIEVPTNANIQVLSK